MAESETLEVYTGPMKRISELPKGMEPGEYWRSGDGQHIILCCPGCSREVMLDCEHGECSIVNHEDGTFSVEDVVMCPHADCEIEFEINAGRIDWGSEEEPEALSASS